MCCVLTIFALLGPRIAIFVWWLINPELFGSAFSNWILPLLFAIFAPFTMIFFLIAWFLGAGVSGFEWLLIALGIIIDLSTYTGGGYGNRRRFGL